MRALIGLDEIAGHRIKSVVEKVEPPRVNPRIPHSTIASMIITIDYRPLTQSPEAFFPKEGSGGTRPTISKFVAEFGYRSAGLTCVVLRARGISRTTATLHQRTFQYTNKSSLSEREESNARRAYEKLKARFE